MTSCLISTSPVSFSSLFGSFPSVESTSLDVGGKLGKSEREHASSRRVLAELDRGEDVEAENGITMYRFTGGFRMVVWSTTISSCMSSGTSLSSLTILAKMSLGCNCMRVLRRPDRGVTVNLRRGGMKGEKNESEKGVGGQKGNWGGYLLLISHGRTSANTFGMSRSVIFYLILFKAIYIHKISNSVRLLSRLPCRK